MKRKYIILIIFISILLLCVSIGFASWGINGRKSQKVEEDVKSYVVIDLDNISDSEPVFLYNSQGLYSDDGLGYDTSFTVQLNVVEEVAPYNLTISLIDKDNVLLGATITSEIKSSTEEETEAIISGDSSIFIEEINYTTTYYLKFYIHTTESNYSDIYSKLSSEHEELGLKITANTEDGSWSIDKTIILSATFQNLITVEKPTAIQNLEYNGEEQILVNSGTGYTLSNDKQTNAGNYTVVATLKKGYCWSDETITNLNISASISRKTISINGPIVMSYDSSVRTWTAFQTSCTSLVQLLGVIEGDNPDLTLIGMHNGKFKYGSVAGSYVSPSSTTEFGSSYDKVIGSTYQGYFSIGSPNYIFANNDSTVIIQYKTALIGSTYYTIEQAFETGTGTITFAGDSSGTQTYVVTSFTRLSTDLTGYNSRDTFVLNSRKLLVPYTNSTTEYTLVNGSSATINVYSVFWVDNDVTIETSGNANIVTAGSIDISQTNAGTTRTRGILVNHGTINVANGGKLNAYGYYKGNGFINMENGSTMTEVLRMFGFPGGSASSSMYRNVFIINSYSVHNAACNIRIYGGAILNAFAAVYVQGNQSATSCLIGNSGSNVYLFRPTSYSTSNYVLKRATSSNSNLLKINELHQSVQQKDVFEINGNYVDGTLSITVYVSISTDTTKPCPIGLMDIILKSGSELTLSKNDYAFLPGSSLTIEEGSTLAVTNSNIDLTFATLADVTSKSSGGDRRFISYSNATALGDAKMICNGNFSTNGSFGGNIITTSEHASLNFTGSMMSNYRSVYYTKSPYYYSSSESTVFNLYNGSSMKNSVVASGGKYYSMYLNGVYGFYATDAVISYNTNGSTETYNNRSVEIPLGGYVISSNDLPGNPQRDYYVFDDWYLEGDLALGQTIYAGVVLIANYNAINYSIVYHDVNGGEGETQNINPSIFNVETNITLYEPNRGNLVFGGWYLESELVNKISILDGNSLVSHLINNELHLYASWFEEGTETYIIYFDNSDSNGAICPSSDTIIETDGFNWSDYTLPNMSGKDNVPTVTTYFDGWYNGSVKVTNVDKTMFDENNELILTAHYLDKHELNLVFMGGIMQTLYYKSGYRYVIPSLASKGITLDPGLVFIRWELSDGITSTYHQEGEEITLTDQTTLTPDIRQYVTVTIKTSTYTNVTLTLTSNSGYLVTTSNGVAVASQFDGSTKNNGEEFLVTVGSVFAAKFTASSGKNNAASITGTNPTTALSETNKNYEVLSAVVITPTGEDSGCVAPGTLITIYDGSQKEVELLSIGDMIMTWNFFTGQYEVKPIIALEIMHTIETNLLTLELENGRTISIISYQSFFDVDERQYFLLNTSNYLTHIGKNIAVMTEDGITYSKIINIIETKVVTDTYELITANNFNYIANGILTVEPYIFNTNFFTINDDYMYDSEEVENDINTYGLFTYDEWSEYMTEFEFEVFNGKYFKIAIAKGLVTLEQIFGAFEIYNSSYTN